MHTSILNFGQLLTIQEVVKKWAPTKESEIMEELIQRSADADRQEFEWRLERKIGKMRELVNQNLHNVEVTPHALDRVNHKPAKS